MFYQNQVFIDGFISLIKECNKIVLDIYNSDFDVITKDDNTPLTLADKKCNTHICNYLKSNFRNILIISEENKSIDYKIRRKYDYCWLIDPIDGTKEFVKKNGQFTVNIGLCKYGIPVFGIVSIPTTGDIYYGVSGLGSFKLFNNRYNNFIYKYEKIKLNIQEKNLHKSGLKIVASSSHLNNETEEFINQFKNPSIVNTGSSIKLLWVAEVKADIYPRLGPTSEWDTCAAHAIVKYAGGKVLKYKNISINKDNKNEEHDEYDEHDEHGEDDEEEELIYNKKNILNPFFIVL